MAEKYTTIIKTPNRIISANHHNIFKHASLTCIFQDDMYWLWFDFKSNYEIRHIDKYTMASGLLRNLTPNWLATCQRIRSQLIKSLLTNMDFSLSNPGHDVASVCFSHISAYSCDNGTLIHILYDNILFGEPVCWVNILLLTTLASQECYHDLILVLPPPLNWSSYPRLYKPDLLQNASVHWSRDGC